MLSIFLQFYFEFVSLLLLLLLLLMMEPLHPNLRQNLHRSSSSCHGLIQYCRDRCPCATTKYNTDSDNDDHDHDGCVVAMIPLLPPVVLCCFVAGTNDMLLMSRINPSHDLSGTV
mmetsp:Transcript_10050/g.11579  ORF Transcript_10050/g.11579 Transcript_10050/m.11579 type:complete len:115 (+) Transcript_10050:113-457(+)